ncbi:MAG: HAD-IIB family hydrolase [Pseudomonadota bacterium]|nr:HAD-IIB family hydrolase [Pseudomonadota bacterium]
MTQPLLICTDMDRTLLPNGDAPESPRCREHFATVARQSDVRVAYVTGRDRTLVEAAIEHWSLTRPDFVIGDVGTTLYEVSDTGWRISPDWRSMISSDWAELGHDALVDLLDGIEGPRAQEAEKQGEFKLSYYVPLEADRESVLEAMWARLAGRGLKANLVWSVDEPAGVGLLDVLPASAGKLHAIEFLIRMNGFARERCLFAGDSGNDLQVLTSPVKSVLVANASPGVREEAQALATAAGNADTLYIARGGVRDLNGNYAAGILEGLAHFFPWTVEWWR